MQAHHHFKRRLKDCMQICWNIKSGIMCVIFATSFSSVDTKVILTQIGSLTELPRLFLATYASGTLPTEIGYLFQLEFSIPTSIGRLMKTDFPEFVVESINWYNSLIPWVFDNIN